MIGTLAWLLGLGWVGLGMERNGMGDEGCFALCRLRGSSLGRGCVGLDCLLGEARSVVR